MRNITVYSTSNGTSRIESAATTWAELKSDMVSLGISSSNMKAIIGETRTTLESSMSVLPEGDFKLFLTPVKTKSGGSYRELRKKISELVNTNPEARDFFNEDRNYTNKTYAELTVLYGEWSSEYEEEDAPVKVISKFIEYLKELNEEFDYNSAEEELAEDALECLEMLIENLREGAEEIEETSEEDLANAEELSEILQELE